MARLAPDRVPGGGANNAEERLPNGQVKQNPVFHIQVGRYFVLEHARPLPLLTDRGLNDSNDRVRAQDNRQADERRRHRRFPLLHLARVAVGGHVAVRAPHQADRGERDGDAIDGRENALHKRREWS